MCINNVEFSQCRTTHTPPSDTAQQHSTAPHSTATQHSTSQQHSTATQHSTAQQHIHSLPFTRACLEFPTTLTCRALYGKAHCHSYSLPFTRACLDVPFTLTCRALDGKSHCHSCSLPFVLAPFRTPQENRVVAVTFETIKKIYVVFSILLVSPGHLMTIQEPYSWMDDNRRITKTAEKLHKSPSGTLGRID